MYQLGGFKLVKPYLINDIGKSDSVTNFQLYWYKIVLQEEIKEENSRLLKKKLNGRENITHIQKLGRQKPNSDATK